MSTAVKKSSSQKLKEDITGVIIAVTIAYVVLKILKLIFYPFIIIFKDSAMTDEEITEDAVKKALSKAHARWSYLARKKSDKYDWYYQYNLRFIEKPEEYKNDPENEKYLKWYRAWKDGEVLDTRLRWVPDIYIGSRILGTRRINPAFLRYFELQYNLHKNTGWFRRHYFLSTVRNYFPEFSGSGFKELEAELEYLKAYSYKRELKIALIEELQNQDISFGLAVKLAEENLSKEELKKKVRFLKLCRKHNIREDIALILYDYNIDPRSENAERVVRLRLPPAEVFKDGVPGCYGAPEEVVRAYLSEKISSDDLPHLQSIIYEAAEENDYDYSKTIEATKEKIQAELEKCICKNNAERMRKEEGEPIWEQASHAKEKA